MNKHINKLRDMVEVLEAFGQVYQLDIPDNLTSISVAGDTPSVNVFPQFAPDAKGREKVLAHVGITFGVRGWTAKPTYGSGTDYDWIQTFMGVQVKVHEAEKLPQLQPKPVPVNAWPVMLNDTSASDDDMENYH